MPTLDNLYEAYVLCTAPRSGSTLLCKLLAATGIAGRPGSHFHEPSLAEWLEDYDLPDVPGRSERDTVAAVFAAAIDKGRGGTPIFGLRLQRHSFAFFSEKLALLHREPAGDVARMRAAFGRTLFIYLTRADKVDQAVSLVRAEQTGLWHRAADGSELERTAPPREPAYHGEAISAAYERLLGYEREWAAWFDREGLAPLRLTYADLSADPAGTLARVLKALGLPPETADGITPGVAKLADETNRAWVARFRAERGLSPNE
ncbi:Stf0 family sulfotransferase [Aquibium carbonis]|uniref:Stf0 family sulfotransferase n=1 Tax=Aquibium carbonis TaxID=2495581 RepID=UPI001FE1ED1E|nr:Stf0 family sulfotransferase [Aquibium carbonis]